MHREINRARNSDVIHPGFIYTKYEIYSFLFYKFSLIMTFKIVNILLDINVRFSCT